MAVTDWKKMKDKLVGVVAEIDARPPPLKAEELAEGKAFLSWLAADHYTLLAYRCHDLVVVDDYNQFGSCQAIWRLPDGYLGASDPRRDGQAAGF